jgi:hypothetical protein
VQGWLQAAGAGENQVGLVADQPGSPRACGPLAQPDRGHGGLPGGGGDVGRVGLGAPVGIGLDLARQVERFGAAGGQDVGDDGVGDPHHLDQQHRLHQQVDRARVTGGLGRQCPLGGRGAAGEPRGRRLGAAARQRRDVAQVQHPAVGHGPAALGAEQLQQPGGARLVQALLEAGAAVQREQRLALAYLHPEDVGDLAHRQPGGGGHPQPDAAGVQGHVV